MKIPLCYLAKNFVTKLTILGFFFIYWFIRFPATGNFVCSAMSSLKSASYYSNHLYHNAPLIAPWPATDIRISIKRAKYVSELYTNNRGNINTRTHFASKHVVENIICRWMMCGWHILIKILNGKYHRSSSSQGVGWN